MNHKLHVLTTQFFMKRFRRLPSLVRDDFPRKLKLFLQGATDPLFRDKQLTHNLYGLRAFHIKSRYHVIYQIFSDSTVRFIDIVRSR